MANVSTIDVGKVNQAGITIIENGAEMYRALKDIKDIIDNTKRCFQSDGGDKARSNFNSSAEKFEEFKKFIDEYGQFLQSYSGLEVKLDEEIESLGASIPKL